MASDEASEGPKANLSGRQRAHLKGLAHDLKPVVQVGHDGVTPGVIAQVDAALSHHELIKVRLSRPEDKHGMAAELAGATGAELCGLVGHTVILYRRNPERPRITVPT
jgi:RNA-binding protein